MAREKIVITKMIPQIGIDLLQDNFELDIYDGEEPISADLLADKVASADALLSMVTDPIDRNIIDRGKHLQIISNHAVGFNNIDVDYATEKGIPVTNTPGVLTDATADLTWALLMAVTRRIVEGDRMMRSGRFKGWDPLMLLGADLVGKTLGIIGAGRIGTAVIERSAGWKMQILYYDIEERAELNERFDARRVDMDELLRESDFISIHTILSEETHHLISSRELELMKPSAYLINAARGPIVDEKALVKALKEKQIAGAALDVFEQEPKMEPELGDLDNVVVVPHIGSATWWSRNKMAETAARNIIKIMHGEEPISIVNPEVLQRK